MIRWALVVACLLDAVSEAALRDSNSGRDTIIALVSAVALMIDRRIGAAITAIGLVFTLSTSHEFLVMSIAALVAIFPSPRQLMLLVKVQLTAMWMLAALAKLHPAFRSGEVLGRGELLLLDSVPVWVLVWGTIIAEGAILPLLLWFRPRMALWAAVMFQTTIMIGMSTFMSAASRIYQLSYVTALFSFGILTLACVWSVTSFDRRNRECATSDPSDLPLDRPGPDSESVGYQPEDG